MIGIIGAIVVGSGFFLGIYLAVRDWQNWNRLIEAIGEQAKEKELVFVEEERCSYCGKPISKQEYERERYGYCDECTDDLMTEEEDYGDKEDEGLWGM